MAITLSHLDVPQSPSLFPTPLYKEDSYFYTSEKETNTFGARHYLYIFASFLKQRVIEYLYGLGIIEIVYIMTSVIKKFTLSLREEYRCPNVFLKHKMFF